MTEDVRHSEAVVRDEASSASASRPLAQPGKYSIECILALDEYSRTTSIWHVLKVIVVTPLLPLLAIIAYELPPLQPIEAGWRANWVFFVVRLGGGMAIACEAGLIVARQLMPVLDSVLSARVRALMALASGTLFVLIALALAQFWGFPIPFTTSIVNPVGGSSALVMLFIAARDLVYASRDLKWQLVFFCCFITTIPVMTIVYPAYMALFQSVGQSYQPLVMLLVPVIKILFRKLINRIAAEWEDLVPIMVIFSIELFNALYQVVCVQSGGSMVTTAAVMAIDLAHAARSQWRLHHSTAKLQKVFNIRHGDALLPLVCALCEDATALQTFARLHTHVLQTLRLHSALSRSGLSTVGLTRLESIGKIGVFSSAKGSFGGKTEKPGPEMSGQLRPLSVSSRKISPLAVVVTTARLDSPQPTQRKMSEKTAARVEQGDAIVEAATMLFRSEYLLLGEYLECIVPLIYATKLIALWLSPNAAFYPHTRAITISHEMLLTVSRIAALFALEIATFILLTVVLWKRLKFSPLHQLSYVLEHQASVIQANMFLFLVLSSQFNLDHVGADFSFQFKWLA